MKVMDEKTTKRAVAVAETGSMATLSGGTGGQPVGKVFLADLVGLTGCEISLNRLEPGIGYPFRHKHKRNEEVYIVTSGRGTLYGDGVAYLLVSGSVVRLSPDVDRCLTAADDSPLEYVCVQAPEGAMPYRYTDDGQVTGSAVPYPKTFPMPARVQQRLKALGLE